MAKQFTFGSNLLELDIAGHEFKINPNSSKIKGALKQQQLKFQELAGIENETDEDIFKLNQTFNDTINVILGEGASEKIFEGQDPDDFFARLEVFKFLSEEILAHSAKTSQKYGLDRVMR